MKLGSKLRRLKIVLMLLIFGFIGATMGGYYYVWKSKVLTLTEAGEKEAYWHVRGLLEYTVERSGYTVVLTKEGKRQKVEILVNAVLNWLPEMLVHDARSLDEAFYRLEELSFYIEAARRLGEEELFMTELFRRIHQRAEKSRAKIIIEREVQPVNVYQMDIIRFSEWVTVVIVFYLLEFFPPVFHIPIHRLCGFQADKTEKRKKLTTEDGG